MLARDTGAYRKTQELLKIVCELSNLFPRQIKHTIGQHAINSCIEMLTCIQMANLTKDDERLRWFDEFLVYEERLRTLMEVGMDTSFSKANTGRIGVYTSLIADVGRQMTGWRKSCRSQHN